MNPLRTVGETDRLLAVASWLLLVPINAALQSRLVESLEDTG